MCVPAADKVESLVAAFEGGAQMPGLVEPKLVWVDKTEIQMVDGEYVATLTGNYPDGCSTLGGIETTVAGETISVAVFADSPPGATCTSVLVPFEETIVLDLVELESGEYTVVVNETATTTLTMN